MQKLNMSQLVIMNIHYYFYTLEHFLDTMAELDMRTIDLWAGHPHLYLEDSKACAARVAQIQKEVASRSMKIVCLTPEQVRYPFNISSNDPEVRRRGLDYLLLGLDVARDLGATLYQVVPGFGVYDYPLSEAWQHCAESLHTLAEKAANNGITVVVEPLQIVESNLIVDRFTAQKMLQDVNHPGLKTMVDTCHMAKKGESLADYFALLGDDICHIHLNETNQVPWGEGDLPLDTYLQTLAEYDYRHYMTMEICSMPHHVTADAALQQNVSYVKQHMQAMFGA